MKKLHEQTGPIISALLDHLLAVLPAGWMTATLHVHRSNDLPPPYDVPPYEAYWHRISSSDQGPGEAPAQPDEKVFESTAMLIDTFRNNGEPLEGFVVTVQWLADEEKWDYVIDFKYSPEFLRKREEEFKARQAGPEGPGTSK